MGLSGETCKNDNDCPDKQFCYNTSGRCVDTLDCSRYNRKQGKIHASDPSQCGPCMKGYSSEVLASGKETPICKYTEKQDELDTTSLYIIILIIAAVIVVIIALIVYSCRRRNKMASRRNYKLNNASDIPEVASNNLNAMIAASAPEEEQDPFVGFSKKKCDYVPYNNNEGIRETNQYQTSFPFTCQYRPINAYSDGNNMNMNNCNSNPLNGQVAIPMPENHTFTETEETDLPNNDELPNAAHDNENSDTTDSAFIPDNQGEQRQKSKNIIITQMVQQNITLHLKEEE